MATAELESGESMNVMLQWLLVCAALAAIAGGVVVERRIGRRRRRARCRRIRDQALHVARIAEGVGALARSVDTRPESTPWKTLADQGLWLTCETLELRQQDRHPGLRKATRDLCDALLRLEVAMHRRRRLLVPDGARPDQRAIVARQYRTSVDDFVFAARFLGIAAHVDQCVDGARCSCGPSSYADAS